MLCSLPDLTAAEKFAHVLAKQLAQEKSGTALLLSGPLGSGKTTLARLIIKDLIPQVTTVISPTFPIVQEYGSNATGGLFVAHYDLYRLEKPSDLNAFDISGHLERGICIVEWPDLAASVIAEHATMIYTLNLQLTDEEGHKRTAHLGYLKP